MAQTVFPLQFSKLSCGTEFITTIATSLGGGEQRIRHRTNGRDFFNAAFAVKNLSDIKLLRDFFLVCGGRFKTFLLYDPIDNSFDRTICSASGDGLNKDFQLRRKYTDYLGNVHYKIVRRPKNGTIQVWVDNVLKTEETDYLVDYDSTGLITFNTAPAANAVIEFSGEFYKVCRFDVDSINLELLHFWVQNGADYGLIQPPEIPLIEVFT